MDINDILLQNDNVLPTLEQGASTASAKGDVPSLPVSSSTLWKFGVSSAVGLIGTYYLWAGMKQKDIGKIIIGTVLTLASFFVV